MSAVKKQKTDDLGPVFSPANGDTKSASGAAVGAAGAAASVPVPTPTPAVATGSSGSGAGGGGGASDLVAKWQTIAQTSTRQISTEALDKSRKEALKLYGSIDDSDAQSDLGSISRLHHADLWASEFKRITTNDGKGGRPSADKIHGMRVCIGCDVSALNMEEEEEDWADVDVLMCLLYR